LSKNVFRARLLSPDMLEMQSVALKIRITA